MMKKDVNPLKEVHTAPVIITETHYGIFFVTKRTVQINPDGTRKILAEKRY